jgi:hypothetical protein
MLRRIRGARFAYFVALSFELPKPQAAYRALRFLLTGNTGRYAPGVSVRRARG